MASPPNTSGLNLPQKRPGLALPTNPTTKRRKPSTGPSHLRQTSFPPPEASGSGLVGTPVSFSATTPRPYSRSPSVDSSVAGTTTTSLVNGVGGGGGVGRKKKKKKGADADDARSMTGTSLKGGKAGSAAGAEGEAEEEDEGGEGDVEVNLEGGKVLDDAAKKQERQREALLIANLDEDQRARYAIWRAVKLKKEIVRRITNQTLSQSVPQSVILTINGYTKTFIGELIDRARQVQLEWHYASLNDPYPEKLVRDKLQPVSTLGSANSSNPSSQIPLHPQPGVSPTVPRAVPSPYASPVVQNSPTIPSPAPAGAHSSTPTPAPTPTPAKQPPTRGEMMGEELGPLTPDHLREALRRYKKDREGKATGFLGLSLEGRENAAARMAGRKLFQ